MLEEFSQARPRLLSMAHRMVGSVHDAEDIVQNIWLRARRADTTEIENPTGWLTTVAVRLCLDHLRARERRDELPLLIGAVPDERLAPEEEFLRRDAVSRALMVLLSQLTPGRRVAFVLHDVFAVPFDQIARAMDTSTASAKKLASRARHRLRAPGTGAAPLSADHERIVAAFLDAARGGDLDRLAGLMAPGAVRTADSALLPAHAPRTVRGARAVAEGTQAFLHRIRMAVPMTVEGEAGAVVAPAGRPVILLTFAIDRGAVARVALSRYRGERLSRTGSDPWPDPIDTGGKTKT